MTNDLVRRDFFRVLGGFGAALVLPFVPTEAGILAPADKEPIIVEATKIMRGGQWYKSLAVALGVMAPAGMGGWVSMGRRTTSTASA